MRGIVVWMIVAGGMGLSVVIAGWLVVFEAGVAHLTSQLGAPFTGDIHDAQLGDGIGVIGLEVLGDDMKVVSIPYELADAELTTDLGSVQIWVNDELAEILPVRTETLMKGRLLEVAVDSLDLSKGDRIEIRLTFPSGVQLYRKDNPWYTKGFMHGWSDEGMQMVVFGIGYERPASARTLIRNSIGAWGWDFGGPQLALLSILIVGVIGFQVWEWRTLTTRACLGFGLVFVIGFCGYMMYFVSEIF